MVSSNNRGDEPATPSGRERLLAELRRLEWAKELSEETLSALTNTAEYVEFGTGAVVIEVESEITHVSFLITGRMQAILYDMIGKEILKHEFVRGSVVGLFSLALPKRSHFELEATEPTTAIRLTFLAVASADRESCRLSTRRVPPGGEPIQTGRNGESFPSDAIRSGYCSSHRRESSVRQSPTAPTSRAG